MTTDNRTNEPTEAQVKLAYLAHLKAPRTRGMDVYGPMRAALVAAQGAAPQAEPDPYQIVRVLHEHQRDTSVVSRVKCACGVTCEGRASHRLHQAELIAHLEAAPVLPSSGVDEDKLAEAWERGHAAVEQAWESDHLFPYDYVTDNPYRKEESDD